MRSPGSVARRGQTTVRRPAAWSRAAALAALVVLASCVTIDYPQPGRPIKPRNGETLVFARVRLFDDSHEYFPWSATNIPGPELHLWLLKLESRRVSPELQLEPDGSFRGWLKAGDYALIANRHAVTASYTSDLERQDMEVLALLRVPPNDIAAYAGILEIELRGGVVDLHHLQTDYEFGAARTSAEPLGVAQESLEEIFGPLPRAPGVSLFCTGDDLPDFHDPQLSPRGRSLLNRGCATSRT
jgi:hypothetical protein